MCFGFFELKPAIVRTSQSQGDPFWEAGEVFAHSPDDVHSVLASDGLRWSPSQIPSQTREKYPLTRTLHPSHNLLTDDLVFIPRTRDSVIDVAAAFSGRVSSWPGREWRDHGLVLVVDSVPVRCEQCEKLREKFNALEDETIWRNEADVKSERSRDMVIESTRSKSRVFTELRGR